MRESQVRPLGYLERVFLRFWLFFSFSPFKKKKTFFSFFYALFFPNSQLFWDLNPCNKNILAIRFHSFVKGKARNVKRELRFVTARKKNFSVNGGTISHLSDFFQSRSTINFPLSFNVTNEIIYFFSQNIDNSN